jgi:hypothetical protein
MKKSTYLNFIIFLTIAFSLAGCAENRYYHQNHHHSPEYSQRHNEPPEPGVNVDVHN